MAWVTPTNVAAGDAILASKWNQDVVANAVELAPFMAAWTTFTPTIAQGTATNISKTVTYSKYVRVGKMLWWQFRLDVTGAGTFSNAVTLTMPVNPVFTSVNNIGVGTINDASGPTMYNGSWIVISNLMYFVGDWSSANTWGTVPNIALASSDTISGNVVYEVA